MRMLKTTVRERQLTESEASVVCSVLVTRLGGSYSRLLGINLASMESDEAVKWFIAAILLGSPVRMGSALSAFRGMESAGLLKLQPLAVAEESVLIDLLVVAGVTRASRRIAVTLQRAAESLVVDYDADINRLHFFAEDADDLVHRLHRLGDKVPYRAVKLFLREMRGVWDKARPCRSDSLLEATRSLGLVDASVESEVADKLRCLWERVDRGERTYSDFQVALVRLGETYCRKGCCNSCPMSKLCISRRPASAPGEDVTDHNTAARSTA